MKATIKAFLILSLFAFTFNSCKEEDEENELHIDFTEGASYVSTDTTLPGGSSVTIGIEAETEKPSDPIISFNISESVNGAAAATVYQDDSVDATIYVYDYAFTLDTVSGVSHKYTFTITNRDGINKQSDLTITVQ